MRFAYCTVEHCWRSRGHPGPHGGQNSRSPLTCVCPTPQPTPTDQCDRCLRVIAELVRARRRLRRRVAS